MNAIWDVPELNLLSGLQQKRRLEAQVAAQNKAAVHAIMARGNAMAAAAVTNGTTTPTAADSAPVSSSIEEDAGSIVNRSPVTTNNHYYGAAQPVSPTPTPTPVTAKSPLWPWLLAIPLALALGGLAWYLWPKTPAIPQKPPDWTADPTIILRDAP